MSDLLDAVLQVVSERTRKVVQLAAILHPIEADLVMLAWFTEATLTPDDTP